MSQSNNHDRPMLGIVLMILAMMVIPLLDIFAKQLSEFYHPLQITWGRFVFNVIWVIPLLLWRKEKWWRMPNHPWVQILRGLGLVSATFFFFLAIKYNPIPNALALMFISPLVITLLSPFVLGETVGIRRLMATLVGFVGVIIVLQPTADEFQPTMIFALLSGFSYAMYILVTRKVSTSSSPLMTLFYTALVGAVAMTPALPAVWVMPDVEATIYLAAIGLLAAIGHFLVTLSCRMAPASLVAPFNYAEILAATLLSYLFFDYLPNAIVWLGIVIICGSGVYISLRELKAKS